MKNEFFSKNAQAAVIFEKNEQTGDMQAILKQGGQEIKMQRLAAFDPDKVDLSAYAGNYYSPELETTYLVLVENGKLLARHQRHPDIELKPVKTDEFFGQLKFIRDNTKTIDGCTISNGRVRNLRFDKVK